MQPWCYTTDPNTRWEHCSVTLCIDDSEITNDSVNILLTAIAITTSIIIILILNISIFLCYKCSKIRVVEKDHQDSATLRENGLTQNEFELNQTNFLKPVYIEHADINITELTEGWEGELPKFPRNGIVYISELSQGNFGVVIKAQAKNIIPGEESTTVAIKVLKEGSNDQTAKNFFVEATLMHKFNHQNILKLFGVCIEEKPFCMLFEYMEYGDLNSYLRKHKVVNSQFELQGSLPLQYLVNMCINIATGLKYLAHHCYVHCDLATRNCLVDSNITVKIADFGLSQDIHATGYYRLPKSALLPIRWMPPEVIIDDVFTLQSDVWSFGIVLWEIFSFGNQPYSGFSNNEVFDYVRNGEVLECPPGTPTKIYDLMKDCWEVNQNERPTAAKLHTTLCTWNPNISASQQPYENMAVVKEINQKKGIPKGSAASSDDC